MGNNKENDFLEIMVASEETYDGEGDDFEVEFEVTPAVETNAEIDAYRERINAGLSEVDAQIDAIQNKINDLNKEIDRLTNNADGLDYMVAVGSGILCGLIDVIFVGQFSIQEAHGWGKEKVEDFTKYIARTQGYDGDDIYKAVSFLEEKFPLAADKATYAYGGGLQHHLRDFSHHPTPVGLMFSLLTQFTGNVYGSDTNGIFKIVPLGENANSLLGKSFPEKITLGAINWFFHMASDVAGSSGSIKIGGEGTGVPGPILSLLKEISALPIFKSMNENGNKEFSVWISKLFNGTLLAVRDEDGNITKPIKFDLRTEIGILGELGKQSIPVVINECLVRGFYFIRRLCKELKEKDIRSVKDLGNIDWERTLPVKNRTIIRMLTISTGTFTAIDLADAAIESAVKSKGAPQLFLANMVLKVNFVGVGRFAVAVVTDIGMGIQRQAKLNERVEANAQLRTQLNVKVLYKDADVWCEMAELYEHEEEMYTEEADLWVQTAKTQVSMEQLYESMEKVVIFYSNSINNQYQCMYGIAEKLPEAEKLNPGITDIILGKRKRRNRE